MSQIIGLLTAGSDCPGLNAAIRAIGKAAQTNDVHIVGFQDGFEGLLKDQIFPMTGSSFSGILSIGGTILGTSRTKPHQVFSPKLAQDQTDLAVKIYEKYNLDALVCVGGLETQESALKLSKKGLNIITLPKAIDNSLSGTDTTIGFDTALSVATEAIDRLHSTALSQHRIVIVEITGEEVGWLSLGAGISGGADVILLPEIPYDIEKVAAAISRRSEAGKRFSIVSVAEGAISRDYYNFFEHSKRVNERLRSGPDKETVAEQLEKIESRLTGTTMLLAERLEQLTGLETRITILGHLLRGGTPSYADRLLATRLGTECLSFIKAKTYGVMISVQNGTIQTVPLDQVATKIKTVPMDHPWIKSARQVGTNMGD